MNDDTDFDADLYISYEDYSNGKDYDIALNQARVNKAINTNNRKYLAEIIWDITWVRIFANGYYCDKEDVAVAIKAYNFLGYDSFIEHSSQSKIKTSEAIANIVCLANYHKLSAPIDLPLMVQRMVKVYYILNKQGDSLVLGVFSKITNKDYRWFFNLNRN